MKNYSLYYYHDDTQNQDISSISQLEESNYLFHDDNPNITDNLDIYISRILEEDHSHEEEINNNKLYSTKDTSKQKANNKKIKRKQKKIFVIKKDGDNKKKKEIITGNGKKKINNSTKRESNRKPNIRDMIITNFIQVIIRNWINYKQKDKKKILQKINPSIFKKSNYLDLIKNKTIEEIFKLEISKRIKNKNINKEIINNSDKKNQIKFKFTLKQMFLAFNKVSSREEILIEIFPGLKLMKTEDKNLYVKNFYTGLKEKEEYFKEKKEKRSQKNQKKFDEAFNDLLNNLEKNN